jgi:3-deoxy-manno-octulosonate cytidylyltransferase (CMP-KDO synthetase)
VSKSTLIVIPARYQSSRFPGKPLVLLNGISLVERVYQLSSRVGKDIRVVIATDDARIERHVREFGGDIMMTRKNHPSGTDRVAEVARKFNCKTVINVQGDEPLLNPKVIRKLVDVMQQHPTLEMATLCHSISDEKDYLDPNVVKVVKDQNGNALYFSRSPIPFVRDQHRTSNFEHRTFFRHIGIYAYRRDFLLKYVRWPQSNLEKLEKLEQLRALERGIQIRVLETNYHAIGVDVVADVKKVEKLLDKQKL